VGRLSGDAIAGKKNRPGLATRSRLRPA